MNQLLFGDCLEIGKQIDDQSVDMALLDLPFGKTRNKWDILIDPPSMWGLLSRIMKPGGAVACFAVQPFSSLLTTSNLKGYKHTWYWDKKQSGNFAVTKYQPLSVIEEILVFTCNGEKTNYYPKMRKGKMRYRGSKNSEKHGRGFGKIDQVYYQSDDYHPTNLLSFPAVSHKGNLHASQKPVDLLQYLIETYTLPGQTVIDIAMGSGSTIEAAIKSNRDSIGIEKDYDCYQVAVERINKLQIGSGYGHSFTQGNAGSIANNDQRND
jgi:site-specific DNA-methyltransferase (adenine-specific)